jgi:FkbM family methyltransferase
MPRFPPSLYVKSFFVGSSFQTALERIRWIASARHSLSHPEMFDISLEGGRIERALREILKRDSCCIDVGCHIGSFLSLLLRIAPDGKHTAIEASPEKSSWLKAKFPKVDVQCVAAGRKTGSVTFYEDLKRPGFSGLFTTAAHPTNAYQVEMRRLDDILAEKQRIDFIKLDIEGAELDAIKGANCIIAKYRPAILFECGPESTLQFYSLSRKELYDTFTNDLRYLIYSPSDFIYGKGELSFDEFRKCGIFPFRAFNFLALPQK